MPINFIPTKDIEFFFSVKLSNPFFLLQLMRVDFKLSKCFRTHHILFLLIILKSDFILSRL